VVVKLLFSHLFAPCENHIIQNFGVKHGILAGSGVLPSVATDNQGFFSEGGNCLGLTRQENSVWG